MRRVVVICSLLSALVICSSVFAVEYRQLPGVIHVHTTFSSGRCSIEQLVVMAGQKGIEVLIPTDHDLVVMEYGLFPLKNVIKKREERKSILKAGPEKYLAEIKRQNQRQKDVIVVPGVQSSPFYYWTGSPFKKNLVANDYRKELLLVGLQNPGDYHHLPILHRGFSTQYLAEFLPRSILFLGSFTLGIYLLFQKGIFRYIGGIIAIIGLLLLINYHPFESSRYDPYHGSLGIAPYQETIDYVNQRGGFAFWAHPESNYSISGVKLGPATLMTKPYPEALGDSRNYTGFSAIYGDTVTATDPGKHWDQVLLEYCKGERDKPVWGIAGADFHTEKRGVELDTFQTIFLVREKSNKEVLNALASGRVYSLRKEKGPRLILENFSIRDESTGNSVGMGEELILNKNLSLHGKISASDEGFYQINVTLIKGGKVWQTFEGKTPLAFHFTDPINIKGKSYYRLDVQSRKNGRLLSNPIFFVKG